jgi:UDP-galactopyranose mutase
MMKNLIDHPKIKIELETKFEHKLLSDFEHTFNSMAIDEYFGFRFGLLPYRSLKFHHIDLPIPRVYPVPTVNFTHSGPFTRLTEWKNLPNHGGNPFYTSLTIEEPCDFTENNFERYYPVKDKNGVNRQCIQ